MYGASALVRNEQWSEERFLLKGNQCCQGTAGEDAGGD